VEKKHQMEVASLLDRSDFENLGRKVPSLVASLPKVSPVRQGLVKHFAKEFGDTKIAKLFNISTQTVRLARKLHNDNLYSIRYKPNIKRNKIPDTHIQKIHDFWHDHTYPIPWKKTVKHQGKKDKKTKIELPYFSQHDTDSAIMSKFKDQTGLDYCNSTLLKYKPIDIHIATQQFCVCHYCREGHDNKQKLSIALTSLHKDCKDCTKDSKCPKERGADREIKEKLADLRQKVEEYKEHKEIADHQAGELVKMKENLKDGECLVVEDFAGRFLIKADLQLSQEDFFARKGVPDLVLFAYYKQNGKLTYKSFDILAKASEKDDFSYLRSAWLTLLNETSFFDQFKKIIIFSDGGLFFLSFSFFLSLIYFLLFDPKKLIRTKALQDPKEPLPILVNQFLLSSGV